MASRTSTQLDKDNGASRDKVYHPSQKMLHRRVIWQNISELVLYSKLVYDGTIFQTGVNASHLKYISDGQFQCPSGIYLSLVTLPFESHLKFVNLY